MKKSITTLVSLILCLLLKQSLCGNYGGSSHSQNYYGSVPSQDKQRSGKASLNYDTHLLENHYKQLYQEQLYQGNIQQYSQKKHLSGLGGYGRANYQKGSYRPGYYGNTYADSYSKGYSGYGKQKPYNYNQGDVSVLLPSSAGFFGNSGVIGNGFGYNSGLGYGPTVGSGYRSGLGYLSTAGYGYGFPPFGYGLETNIYPPGSPASPYLFQGPSLMDHATGFIKSGTGKLIGSGTDRTGNHQIQNCFSCIWFVLIFDILFSFQLFWEPFYTKL